jgi:hypothetical protein
MKDFNSGNILWGLLRLNEYTNTNSLLRKATLRKYKEEILAYEQTVSFTKKLTKGLKLNELSDNEQFIVKSLTRNKKAESKNNFKVINKNEERKSYVYKRLKRRMS